MATSFLDACRFTPTAGGTTDFTFSSAVTGFQSPAAAGAVNGAVYRYRAESADLTQWEDGYGVYNTSTNVLTRGTVMFNSAGTTAKINFSTTPQVSFVLMAEDLVRVHTVTPGGRLTLTSGTPVTSADVAAATTVYYTPNATHDNIALYDGSNWVPLKFAETSLSLSGLTANTNYDVWGRINAGVLALDTTAWTNDTTRATAITQQDGIDVKSGDATRRLLGTIRITGTTGQTEDSRAKRFVSNRYNDVPRPMVVNDPATLSSAITATSTSYRQANANSANQLDFVCCVPRLIQAIINAAGVNTVNNGGAMHVAIGIDTVPASNQATLALPANLAVTNAGAPSLAYYAGTPGVGRHTILWCEYTDSLPSSASVVWIYTNPPSYLAGIAGTVSN